MLGGAGWAGRVAGAARLRTAAEIADCAGREQEQCEPAEHDQRDRHGRRAGRVDGLRGLATSARIGGVARAARAASATVARRRLVARLVVVRLGAPRGAGVRLARAGELQGAKDVLLGARVVEHVDGQRPDRGLVALEWVDLVDPAVAVPVVDDPLGARERARSRGRRRPGKSGQHDQRDERRDECDAGS